ncbi:hypothetical protein F4694_006154 [Bacillus niacini]|jgi:hypothetical protein|uniref:DUF5081 family protein n=1 Tax=Neobacillus niacini TaxID=86668 RepID=A0A852TKH6_9BACI|nr:hypothetical protein [Neobacillus niacini]NYE09283.1 hypothetical protein [Neobacillus niacini]
MDYIMTCTSAELALLVTLSGYPGVAKGIAEASVGEKSQKEWEAIMEVTTHQLILKQLWDDDQESKGEIPLKVEIQQFIQGYVKSKWMIRCSNKGQSNILMVHHIENDTWMTHIIDRDIIHEFAYIKGTDIPSIIRNYYSFSEKGIDRAQHFHLSDQAFDLLSERHNIRKVRKISSFTPEEEQSFRAFLNDLELQGWSLYNISLFHNPSIERDPILENIVFFLPAAKGIWVVEYTDHPTAPVRVELNTFEQWCDLLSGVGLEASSVNS